MIVQTPSTTLSGAGGGPQCLSIGTTEAYMWLWTYPELVGSLGPFSKKIWHSPYVPMELKTQVILLLQSRKLVLEELRIQTTSTANHLPPHSGQIPLPAPNCRSSHSPKLSARTPYNSIVRACGIRFCLRPLCHVDFDKVAGHFGGGEKSRERVFGTTV